MQNFTLNLILPHLDPKMSFLGPREAKMITKQRTTSNYCYGCAVCGCGGGLGVSGGSVSGNCGGGSTGGRYHRSYDVAFPPELAQFRGKGWGGGFFFSLIEKGI